MSSLNRYKPRVIQEGNTFWKKYLASKAERMKKDELATKVIPKKEEREVIDSKPKKRTNKNTRKQKTVTEPDYSSEEEVRSKPTRKRKIVNSSEETSEKPVKKFKQDRKRKTHSVSDEEEEVTTPEKKHRTTVSLKREKKKTIFDEEEVDKKTTATEDNTVKKNKELDEKELFTLAKSFCQSYQQTQPGNHLLQHAQKKNIRAISLCLSKIINKDKFLYPLLTNEEKTTLRSNHKNLTKLVDVNTPESEKRKLLLENPELTNLTANFLSSLEIYNDDEGKDEMETDKD